MDYKEMRQLETTHHCARCGGRLATIWDDGQAIHRLVCGTDHSHQGIKRLPTASEALAQGGLDELAGPGAQKDLEQLARKLPDRFNLLPKADVETGKPLTPADITALDAFAQSIGLNIYLGHVILYYGEPRVSIDGYYYLAKRQGRHIEVLALPAKADEYERYHVDTKSYFYIARGWEDGKELHDIGIGIISQEETTEQSKKTPGRLRYPIVAKFPQRMTEKRAEWQLLRKLLPLEQKGGNNEPQE